MFEPEWQRCDDARPSGDGARALRDAESVGTGPVHIDVTEEADPDGGDGGSGSDEPTVDVDTELESIKCEVNGDDGDDGADADADDKPNNR